MKFPLTVLDKQQYSDKIEQLLQDPETILVFDTNIFALLHKIAPSARAEFSVWLQAYCGSNRVAIPAWVMSEYIDKFIRSKVTEYYSSDSDAKKIVENFQNVSKYLRFTVEEVNIRGTQYGSLTDFYGDLDLAHKTLLKIKSASRNVNANYIDAVHDELTLLFESTIMESNLASLIHRASVENAFRNQQRFPPGFRDSSKEDKAGNSLGDLIIWLEILDHCKTKSISKVLFITNDNKIDWSYKPRLIRVGGRDIPNQDEIRLADPRLVHEFYGITNSEEFYIINFEFLTKHLQAKDPGSFNKMAIALQLANPAIDTQPSRNETTEDEQTPSQEILASQELIRSEELLIPPPTPTDSAPIPYSSQALCDSGYVPSENEVIDHIIAELKIYSWYNQNASIIKLKNNLPATLTPTNHEDAIFVLGRNIYQAAFGSSFEAIDFIDNLRSNLNGSHPDFVTHLVSGMWYEIYFDSQGEFRVSGLKNANILDRLAITMSDPVFEKAFKFITAALAPFRNRLLFLPEYQARDVTVIMEIDKIPFPIAPPNGPLCHLVKSIKIRVADGDYAMLVNREMNSSSSPVYALDIGFTIGDVNAFVAYFSVRYGIPKQYLGYEVNRGDASDLITLDTKSRLIDFSEIHMLRGI